MEKSITTLVLDRIAKAMDNGIELTTVTLSPEESKLWRAKNDYTQLHTQAGLTTIVLTDRT